ncbi:hypothetical protein SAMN04489727_1937 [Amycolatopsis tolypomycina]|uniref:SAF domain-containing protein n=1 Tax=Amycolatopsis tolypomycina TaxID=208445 RepID=A0A1H4JIP6_9PSEU|nr:SAF domain-containing protein [Amycolatopsis tolypomycina]SEB46143.1 hypothetical protein SAMN04489727_1937 [Amycolatopsis tolypomycina]
MNSTDTPARGQKRVGASAPASWLDRTGAPATPTSRRPRKVPHLAAGALLVVLCAGGTVWWTTSTQDRTPTLAVARPVTVGHVLTSADLRTVDVSASPGTALVPADEAASVLGRPMATNLGPGALLTPDAVGAAQLPAPGRAIVAVGVKPGQFPPALTAGTPITVIVTAAPTQPATTAQGPAAGTTWRATVVDVAPAATDQTSVVSLDLTTTDAEALAQVPAGQLALVMQPAGGGR